MAQDMSVDITTNPDFQAGNAGLLASAGTAEGNAANIMGNRAKDDLEFLGTAAKMAGEGYKVYQANEAGKEASDIMDNLYAPDAEQPWVGEQAKEKVGNIDTEGKTSMELIKAAKDQGVLTAGEAQTRLAAKLKERVAANPYAAESIRKAYTLASGQGNWDVDQMQAAFREDKAKTAAAAKEHELLMFQAKDVWSSGFAGELSVEQVAADLQRGQGKGWDAMVQSQLVKKAESDRKRNEAIQKSDVITSEEKFVNFIATYKENATDGRRTVLMKYTGADAALAPPAARQGMFIAFRQETGAMYDKVMQDAADAFKQQPRTAREQEQFTKHMADLQKEKMETLEFYAKDEKRFLDMQEGYARTAKTTLEAEQLFDEAFMKLTKELYTPEQVKLMKTEDGRKLILQKYGENHPMYQGALQYQRMQVAQANRRPVELDMARQGQEHIANVAAIARGLGPNASDADKAAMQAAIVGGNRATIVQGQLKAQDVGINALKNTNGQPTISPEDTNKVIGAAMNMNDDPEATVVHLKVLTDPTHPMHNSPAIDGYKKKLNERATMWLINDEKELGYSNKIVTSLGTTGSAKDIIVSPEGKLSLNPVYAANAPISTVHRTQEHITRANHLLDIVHFTGGDRKAMAASMKAEMVNTKVNKMGAAQAEANQEIVDTVKGSVAVAAVQGAADFVRNTYKKFTGAAKEEFLDKVQGIESGGLTGGGKDAVSVKGAVGPFQIKDDAMADINKGRRIPFTNEDRKDPVKARKMASIYFDQIKETLKTDDPVVLLAAYNYGMGNVQKLMKKYPEDWITRLPQETQKYIYKMSQAPIPPRA